MNYSIKKINEEMFDIFHLGKLMDMDLAVYQDGVAVFEEKKEAIVRKIDTILASLKEDHNQDEISELCFIYNIPIWLGPPTSKQNTIENDYYEYETK